MNNMRLMAMLAAGVSICVAMMVTSCHGKAHEHDEYDHDAVAEEHEGHAHGDEIILEASKAKAAGVKVERAVRAEFHGVIHTSGNIMAASCDETTVVATTSGRVGQTEHISEGMKVSAGMKLYTLASSDMLMADGDPVQHARITYEKAQRDYARAGILVKDRIISDKDFQVAKAEYEAAKLTYESLSRNRSARGVVVTAPRSGYVKQSLVTEGDYVEAGQPLMVITQNQHLYLRAEVPERYWGVLNSIVGAKFRTSYSDRLYDIAQMGGNKRSYARSANAGNAYIPIIFEFNNTGDVVQGSYAEIYLITDKKQNVITVPLTAVTEEQGLYYLYLRVDEDGYRKQLVTLGMKDGERVEVLNGLKGGEEVVVEGAMQIKLASASNAIPAHTHNH